MDEIIPQLPDELLQRFSTFVHDRFGITLSDEALGKFRLYFEELVTWNQKFNLVSVRSPEEILYRHFADSLAGAPIIARYFPEQASLIDIGTGAGFPGLPLKIAFPLSPLTLVESIRKKCDFLDHMKTRLALQSLTVINDRAEVLGQNPAHRQQYDVVLSRAVTKLSPNLELALPLIKKGGLALIYKTENSVPQGAEMDHTKKIAATLGGELIDIFSYALPNEEQGYRILVLKKNTETPPQYPRRTGVPEKKPM